MEWIMRSKPNYFTMAMLACVMGVASVGRAADQGGASTQPSARAVMEKVTVDVLAILRDHTLSADDKREKFRQIAYENINFDVMARLSLGRFLRTINDAQRTDYQEAFKQLIDYTDEDVKVYGDRQEQDGDCSVLTRITGTKDGKPNQEVAKVEYRLRKQDDQWKVIDITIDGASLVSNYRSQFQEIMSNGGIDQLLKQLHDKNDADKK
jgi:phospholipid transport system substrate-binding protein